MWARQGSNLRPRDYESPALPLSYEPKFTCGFCPQLITKHLYKINHLQSYNDAIHELYFKSQHSSTFFQVAFIALCSIKTQV